MIAIPLLFLLSLHWNASHAFILPPSHIHSNHNLLTKRHPSSKYTSLQAAASFFPQISNLNLNLNSNVNLNLGSILSTDLTAAAATANNHNFWTPSHYFWLLMGAGCGIPISEDALCIFAGSQLAGLSSNWLKIKLVLSLYCGVVLSDMLTFVIGKGLNRNVFTPLRNRMKLINGVTSDGINNVDEEEECRVDEDGRVDKKCLSRQSKRKMIERKIENSGDYIGAVIRFSVGMRSPLMLITGFSNKVSSLKYALGTAVGAVGSLAIQLSVGYSVRQNQKAALAVVGAVAGWFFVSPIVLSVVLSKSRSKDLSMVEDE